MTQIKSLGALALGSKELDRLLAHLAPRRMGSETTLFEVGYEQAKRDTIELVARLANIPANTSLEVPSEEQTKAAERRSFFDKWRR